MLPLACLQRARYAAGMTPIPQPQKNGLPAWFLAAIAIAVLLFAGSFAYDDYRESRDEAARDADAPLAGTEFCDKYPTDGDCV